MDLANIHPWKVSVREAIRIQYNLKKKIILDRKLPRVRKIAGVDVAFPDDKEAVCAVCIFRYPELSLVEAVTSRKKIAFPYISGLLTFREGPAILEVFKKLKNRPDLVLFDGQGICHPRRMGIAAHMGIILDIPSIGCAKSHLYGVYKMPGENKGDFSYIYSGTKTSGVGIYGKHKKEILGVALRTRARVKPLFVSCGHKISLKQAIRLVLESCLRFRIPQPLRYAHQMAESA